MEGERAEMPTEINTSTTNTQFVSFRTFFAQRSSETEIKKAIIKCQVGRGSASYSLARGETKEETLRRRIEEIKVEESDEAKAMRVTIAKALGSVMG